MKTDGRSGVGIVRSSRISSIKLFSYESEVYKHLNLYSIPVFISLTLGVYYLIYESMYILIAGGVLTVLGNVLLYLITYWSIRFRLWCRYHRLELYEEKGKRFMSFEKLVRTFEVLKKQKRGIYVYVEPKEHKGLIELVRLECVEKKRDWLNEEEEFSEEEVVNKKYVFFNYQKRNYFYTYEENKKVGYFQKPPGTLKKKISFFKTYKGNTKSSDVKDMEMTYGLNKFSIPLPSFVGLFQEHALKPFFVFQVFCVLLWCMDEYWYYSVFTLIMLFVFEATVVSQRLKNLKFIRQMRNKPFELYVKREKNKWEKIYSDNLLPFDIVSVKEDQILPCDILLLKGKCVTDESLLTGESTPQIKRNADNIELDKESDILDKKTYKRNILFGGTAVLKTYNTHGTGTKDKGCRGVVLRTGFETSQGKLLRTILFSSEHLSVNNVEALVFILVMLVFAILASAYVLKTGLEDPDRSRWKLFLNCILIITSVVPPELPMELSLAVNSSLVALQKLGVFCTEPFRIPVAGNIDVCCFDKTGTLTSDKMKLFQVFHRGDFIAVEDGGKNKIPSGIEHILASCHSLIVLQKDALGDPMEKAGLEATGFKYSNNVASKGGTRISINKRFPFSSELKRMSVIVDVDGRNNMVFLKGAPETVAKLLKRVPDDYFEILRRLSLSGKRVLALCSREISGQYSALKRKDVEYHMNFDGFAIFQSELKETTFDTIKELLDSDHKIIMITGDNPLTACSVAKSIKIVTKPMVSFTTQGWKKNEDNVILKDQSFEFVTKGYDLCITGDVLERQPQEWLEKWICKIGVYARTTPVQKEQIITTLKKLDYATLMCGDGTNDVGGLKQANVGIALITRKKEKKEKDGKVVKRKAVPKKKPSIFNMGKFAYDKEKLKGLGFVARMKEMQRQYKESMTGDQALVQLGDASIASPFTSKKGTIDSVIHIITQGRCTLVTTMQMYKILALNCLSMAYSLSVLYLDGVKYGDKQMLISGVGIAGCFLFISRAKPLKKLTGDRPVSSIFDLSMVVSMFGQFIINIITMVLLVHTAKISKPLSDSQMALDSEYEKSLLNTVVFIMETFQNIITFTANYEGHPFMQSVFQNKGLLICLAGITGVIFLVAGNIIPDLNEMLNILPIPENFKMYLLLAMVSNWIGVMVFSRAVKWLFVKAKKVF